MTASESTRTRQQASRQPEAQGSGPERVPFRQPNAPAANLRSLHRAAGNRAVVRLLAEAGGQKPAERRPKVDGTGAPLEPDVRAEMEAHFGEDLGEVRMHTGPNAEHAARAVQARAYTIGKEVVFGAGQYAPQTPSGKRLLAHELAHTIQQSRGGEAPSPLPGSPLEQEAERASTAIQSGGPVQVHGASAPGVARQPLSLNNSVDPSLLSDEELADEILEIISWLDANPGSAETAVLEETLMLFEGEAARRIAETPEPQSQAQSQTSPASPAPQVSQDPNQAIADVVQMLNSIQPSPNGIGLYTIVFQGETYEIDEFKRQRISEETRKALMGGINSIRRMANKAQTTYDAIQDVNRDFIVTSSILKFFGGVEDPGPEIKEKVFEANVYANLADAAFKEGDYQGALEALMMSEAPAQRASDLAAVYQSGLISAAETGKQVAAIARDVSLGISIGAAAILATPVVAAGFGTLATGAGLTGLTATGVTAVGTGATITTGGALAGGMMRGGASVIGQAIAGEEISGEVVQQEFGGGFVAGGIAATSGLATARTAALFKPATTLLGSSGQGGVSGMVGGGTGGTLHGILEGKSGAEVLESGLKGGGAGLVGGLIGGGSSHLTGGSGTIVRTAVEVGGGGLGSALGTALTGGSAEDIKQATIIGMITELGASVATPKMPSARQTPQPTGKTTTSTQELPPLPQLTRPSEIVGKPVQRPNVTGAGPLYGADKKPLGIKFPPRRPPLVQVDEYGQPLPTPPRPGAVPQLFDPSQPPPRPRGPRPPLYDPTPPQPPQPATRRRGARPKKGAPSPLELKKVEIDWNAKPPEEPKPVEPQSGEPVVVDLTKTPVLPGARVKFDEPVMTQEEWALSYRDRGLMGERRALIRSYPKATELPPGFEAFDGVEGGTRTRMIAGARGRAKKNLPRRMMLIEGGKAISVKTADLSGKSFRSADGTFSNLREYLDDIIEYPRTRDTLQGVDPETGEITMVRYINPSERVLHIELNQMPTNQQLEGLARVQAYGRQNHIEVNIVAPNRLAF